MSEFWLGVLTPFIILAAAAVVAGLGALAVKLWALVDATLVLDVVKLRPNRFNPFKKDGRPEYLESANLIRDTLLESPRLYVLNGLGWTIAIVRKHRDAPERDTVGTDDLLAGPAIIGDLAEPHRGAST